MKIDVKLFATLRLQLGRGALSIEREEPLTVRELIDALGRQTGTDIGRFLLTEEGELQVGTMILVDGKNIHHLNGLETTVTSADVSIFPPAGGG